MQPLVSPVSTCRERVASESSEQVWNDVTTTSKHAQETRDLRFSHRCCWIFKPSGILRRVDWYGATDVSKDRSLFIFWVSNRRILDLDCFTPEKKALRSFKTSVTIYRSAERTVPEVTMGKTARVCLDDNGHNSTAAWYVTKGDVLWTVHLAIFA